MNTTDQKSDSILLLAKAKEILIDYGIHGVAVTGTLFNILTLIILARKAFKHTFYNFLRCRCACNLLICSLAIFHSDLPEHGAVVADQMSLFCAMYVVNLPLRTAFFASLLSDNLLVLNRLANLREQRGSVFYALSKVVTLSFFTFNKPNRRVSHLPRSNSKNEFSERSSPGRQVYSFI